MFVTENTLSTSFSEQHFVDGPLQGKISRPIHYIISLGQSKLVNRLIPPPSINLHDDHDALFLS